jgi:hypothetical protein
MFAMIFQNLISLRKSRCDGSKWYHPRKLLVLKEYPKHLLIPLTNAFGIEHILPKLPLDLSMMWRLHQVNCVWHKIMGESLESHALNIAWNITMCSTTTLFLPKDFQGIF